MTRNSSTRPWRFFHIALILSAMIDSPVDAEDIRISTGGSTWDWSSEEWTRTENYREIKGYAPRPSEQAVQTVTVQWNAPDLDPLGNICIVRGRLKQTGDKPVNWFQGVTLYLGKTPAAKPDWSRGMDEDDTFSDTTVVGALGEFEFHVKVSELEHDRMRPESFQVGLALAKHSKRAEDGQYVVWNSRTPVIPAAVKMLEIPAAPQLPRELDLINRASGWPFSDPNGVALIRAVNALQPLGKKRALAILNEYIELTKSGDYLKEQESVFWIIRILFEPIRLDDRIPRPAIAVHFEESEDLPLNPIAIVDDIPFMIGQQIGMGGMPEHPSSHIEWARRHGVVRDQPLKPTNNPILAAEAILNSGLFRNLEDFSRSGAADRIRQQALTMIGGGEIEAESLTELQWNTHVKNAKRGRISWDGSVEGFVEDRN